MKSFRKHVAIAIDGGGIRGVIVTKALTMLEEKLGQPLYGIARLYAGTSTGSIISAGLATGMTTSKIHELYLALGESIFRKSWRTFFFPFTRYRYPAEPLEAALRDQFGEMKMGDFWSKESLTLTDLVITAFDALTNMTRFIKPWKLQYQDWPVVKAVLASSSSPTYFPPVDGRYVDGGVGSYSNPCFLAAYELTYCLGWKAEDTTLISLGTGRGPETLHSENPSRYWPWNWLDPVLDAFITSASDQQVRIVETFFKKLDFRRFQVNLKKTLPMDDPSHIPELLEYGQQMGNMILEDQIDSAIKMKPAKPRREIT
jgi:patatin-like phospholipase/acyl hydrolase